MNKIKMKNIIKEGNAKNSAEEKGLKALASPPWEYLWDWGANHGYLDNGNEVSIFPPYDAVKDSEEFFGNQLKDKKGNWMVQVGSSAGRTNKIFWYGTLPVALKAIKNELMPKYAKYKK